jgi:hypothetical protein
LLEVLTKKAKGEKTMPDFGNAGTITVREHDVAALIKLSVGEYIHYQLTVQGAEPIFTFACTHSDRLSADNFDGHPKQVYEWTWGRSGSLDDLPNEPADSDDDTYVVSMSFITAIKYTLVAEKRDANDDVMRTLKDIDYESQDPEDSFTEILRVFTA